MSDDQLSPEPDVQQVSRRLHQSLSACRSMVANYRSMLEDGSNDNQSTRLDEPYSNEVNEAEPA